MSRRLFLLIFALMTTSLSAEIQDHFKPCPDKEDYCHQMRNIDFIYMINLDERPEKFSQSVSQLTLFDIHPYRFSAVNGWKLPLESINSFGVTYLSTMKKNIFGTRYPYEDGGSPLHEIMNVGEDYFCHHMSRGCIGIVLSHLSVLQDAYDSGYKTIWVMEDDIQVIRDPNILSDRIQELDRLVGVNNWDILFTDPDTKNKNGEYVMCLSYAPRPNFTPSSPEKFASRKHINSTFKKIGARYGAYSMIVRRSGMRKILNFIKNYRIFLPYDMEFYLPEGMNIYSLNYDVVSTLPRALSDNGAPNYKLKTN